MPEMNREEIAKLEALYASNPEGRVFTHLAEAYRKGGNYDRARAILQQGLTRHPGYASAYVVLGRVQLDMDQHEEAESSFRRVLDLDPHNLVALRSLGDIARAAGRRDEALGYFEELRHQDPSNVEIEQVVAELRKTPAPAQPAEVAEEAAAAAAPEPEPEVEEAAPAADYAEAPESTAAEEYAAARESSSTQPLEEAAPEEPVREESAPEESAPEEPAPEAAVQPTPEEEPLPEPDTSVEFEIVGAAFEVTGTREPDFGDLVSPDIELNWESGEPESEEEALPGDLAAFAGLDALEPRDESREPEPPPPEEVPVMEFPDLGEPPEEEPAADEGPQAEVVTETMADLYRDQGLYERAAEVYRALLADRPFDVGLQTSLAEVEALAAIVGPDDAAPEAPPPESEPEVETEVEFEVEYSEELEYFEEIEYPEEFETRPFLPPAPEAMDQPPAGYPASDIEDEVESPWMNPQTAATNAPNPYTWKEELPAEGEQGPAITDYFRGLLSWRPAARFAPAQDQADEPEPEPEVANFEATPELENQPAVLELEASFEVEEAPKPEAAPTALPEPPSTPADELMPWEEPASPAMPTTTFTPPPKPAPASAGSDPVEAAFDEWFSVGETEPAPARPGTATPGTPPAPAADQPSNDGEDDDDLEMFRSWLQSLKK